MEQPTGRPFPSHPSELVPSTAERGRPATESEAAARIPDAVAALSYGTRVLARPGGGPRIF